MKRNFFLVTFLLLLSCMAGYFLSKASLVGRVGINLFYKQYKFLKVWWQGAALIFAVWILFFLLQNAAQKKLDRTKANRVHIAAIVLALIGLYFTYDDFRSTTTHRWLGERFHIGGYLFWIGWMIISFFFLTAKKKDTLPQNPVASGDGWGKEQV